MIATRIAPLRMVSAAAFLTVAATGSLVPLAAGSTEGRSSPRGPEAGAAVGQALERATDLVARCRTACDEPRGSLTLANALDMMARQTLASDPSRSKEAIVAFNEATARCTELTRLSPAALDESDLLSLSIRHQMPVKHERDQIVVDAIAAEAAEEARRVRHQQQKEDAATASIDAVGADAAPAPGEEEPRVPEPRRVMPHIDTANRVASRLAEIAALEKEISALRARIDAPSRASGPGGDDSSAPRAAALESLSDLLTSTGRRDEARVAAIEAVALRRHRLDAAAPASPGELAGALDRLSAILTKLQWLDQAISHLEESRRLREQALTHEGAAGRAKLSATLVQLANSQLMAGRLEAGAHSAAEAAALAREAQGTAPDQARLAEALRCLALAMAYRERFDEGAQALEEAIALRRALVASEPAACLADTAGTLLEFAGLQVANHRYPAALAASEEAATLLAAPLTTEPELHLPAFIEAQRLIHLSGLLILGIDDDLDEEADQEAGRAKTRMATADAQAAALEAATLFVSLADSLAEQRPDLFRPLQVEALATRTRDRWNAGLRDQAIADSLRAAGILRTLASERPDTYAPLLASHLVGMAPLLASRGAPGRADALRTARDAVAIWRRLARPREPLFRLRLAESLGILSTEVGLPSLDDEALDAAREAVLRSREAAESLPLQGRRSLAHHLSSLSGLLVNVGWTEDAPPEAFAAAAEAASIEVELSRTTPRAALPSLARTLAQTARCLSALNRPDESLRAMEGSLAVWTSLARQARDTHLRDLQRCMEAYVNACDRQGRRPASSLPFSDAMSVLAGEEPRNDGGAWGEVVAGPQDVRAPTLDAILASISAWLDSKPMRSLVESCRAGAQPPRR